MLRCPGCGLDNPDHARRCARCGGLLHIPENVIPPRARRFFHPERLFYARRRRRGFRWDQPEARPVSGGGIRVRRWRPTDLVTPQAIRDLVWALIPSLFQFSHGRPIRGAIYLAVLLLGLLGVWALPGTRYFYWALWLVILAQVWSLADAIPWQGDFFPRLAKANLFGIVLFIVLAVCYVQITDRVFAALGLFRIDRYSAIGPFRYGMYCRIVPQQEYRPGDVVAFRTDGTQFRRFGERLIDRILAVGPAELRITDRVLLIDGKPCPFRPLMPVQLSDMYPLRLPPHDCCIIPSNFRYHMDLIGIVRWRRSLILGRVEIRFPRWERTGGIL